MWRRLIDWYDDLERERLAVQDNPALLKARSRLSLRRYLLCKLMSMTPVERMELRAFCGVYQGRRLWLALTKFAAAFSVAGVILHLAVDKFSWLADILVANLIGFSMLLAVITAWFNMSYVAATTRRAALYALAGVLAGGFATALMSVFLYSAPMSEVLQRVLERLPRMILAAGVGCAIGLAPVLIVGRIRRRKQEALTRKLQRDAEAERLARELSESKLRMLRAQIEPHFLFNTLGAVQQLAADGAPRAAALTADLIDFLRASFSDMRREQVTLANEFATIAAYLRVMQARMGKRLDFSIDLPDALAPLQVPSMLVLTLVENAIKHGIEPSLRGGAILVSALEEDRRTVVRVRDTGVGMSATPGDGAGLDNVRRRLALAYGDDAALALHDADPGVAAEVVLPRVAAAVQEAA
ncbi:MAG: histidine kinase [Pseudomonadota bacterium]